MTNMRNCTGCLCFLKCSNNLLHTVMHVFGSQIEMPCRGKELETCAVLFYALQTLKRWAKICRNKNSFWPIEKLQIKFTLAPQIGLS